MRRTAPFVVVGLLVAAALAFFVSPHASSSPDGLEKVAIDEGFDRTETPHALAHTPTAGYEVRGVDDPGLSTGLAGILGVAVTFGALVGLLLLVRRGRGPTPDEVAPAGLDAAGT